MARKDAFLTPMEYFRTPKELYLDTSFNKDEKILILTNWKDIALSLDEAQNEGLVGDNRDYHQVELINDCLEKLS